MTDIQFEFNIRQEVKINLNGKIGEVRGLYLNAGEEKMYFVGYADNNGKIIEDWFRDYELSEDTMTDEDRENAE